MSRGRSLVSQVVYLTGGCDAVVREEPAPEPSPGQVLVRTVVSAISAGTELLFYRGQAPADLPVDENIAALAGQKVRYPLKYGYAAVGRVVAVGPGVAGETWLGRLVLAFNPHESYFAAAPADLLPVPASLSPEEAVFLPNLETAVNLVMDGQPAIGEQVAVIGQGIVGLLTTALLALVPLSALVTLDVYGLRRRHALALGAHAALDAEAPHTVAEARAALQGERTYRGADLVYELSGNPVALDVALALTGFNGRVVIGSWYGQKQAAVDLGGRFHRSRIRLISSQVSTIDPVWTGRWTKARRLGVAWEMIQRVRPDRLITHRFPVSEAGEAYRLLDERPGDALQVLLTYE